MPEIEIAAGGSLPVGPGGFKGHESVENDFNCGLRNADCGMKKTKSRVSQSVNYVENDYTDSKNDYAD
jgi:hypothetical protein